MSPDKKNCGDFDNFLVAEKSWCKALSISHHLEISSLLLMSAENNETLNLCSFGALFLGLCLSS